MRGYNNQMRKETWAIIRKCDGKNFGTFLKKPKEVKKDDFVYYFTGCNKYGYYFDKSAFDLRKVFE